MPLGCIWMQLCCSRYVAFVDKPFFLADVTSSLHAMSVSRLLLCRSGGCCCAAVMVSCRCLLALALQHDGISVLMHIHACACVRWRIVVMHGSITLPRVHIRFKQLVLASRCKLGFAADDSCICCYLNRLCRQWRCITEVVCVCCYCSTELLY